MSEPTLNDIYERLGEIKSDQKVLIEGHHDHENRVRSLEKARNMAGGVASVFGLTGLAAFWRTHVGG